MFNSKLLVITIISLLTTICALSEEDSKNSTLQLVHIIFRHGDRTNIRHSLYPKDPHINHTYYPYGLGQLTNRGKQREFQLGKALRARYNHFLDKMYHPDLLDAVSSDSSRTKASLQLVLAGLFPPVGEQVWQEGLNWQPIPYKFESAEDDRLFYGRFCEKAERKLDEYLQTEKVQKDLHEYRKHFDFLSESTGWKIDYEKLFLLFVGLQVEHENGLELPEWTKNYYPQPLSNFALKTYEINTATDQLKQFSVGFLLKKILDDSISKINDTLTPNGRKLFLYSGHEFNVAYLLAIFEPKLLVRVPPYGSNVAIELHKINEVFGIKIYYQDDSAKEPVLLKFCNSDVFCPIDKFITFVENYLPENDICVN